MKEKIYKAFNINIKSIDKDKRVVTFIGTKEITDRDGDIIKVDGMDLKPYKKNPVVLWAHNRYELPIGKTIRIKKINDNQLDFDVEFAPPETYSFADTVYKLVSEGYISATSISFLADRDSIEQNPKTEYGRIFNKTELAELSIVNVPANPMALIQSKSIQKALSDKVINSLELEEFENMLKKLPVREENEENVGNETKTEDTDSNIEQTIEKPIQKSDPYAWIWEYDMEPQKDPDADLYQKIYDMLGLNDSK